MRYRSYGRSDMAVSALTLELKDAPGKARAADWRSVVFSALESGINAFEVHADASPGLTAGAGEALAAIDRHLSFVTLLCQVGAGDLAEGAVLRQAAEAAQQLGLGKFDCLMLQGDPLENLDRPQLEHLGELREVARHIGVSGSERLDDLALRGVVDAVALPYSLVSSVRERSRIRALSAEGVAILAHDPCPAEVLELPAAHRPGLFKRPTPKVSGGYDFVHETWGWTAENICLAYVLTEPGVTSIRISANDPKQIALLAGVVDRDVPGGLGAQVEMARFTARAQPETALRRA